MHALLHHGVLSVREPNANGSREGRQAQPAAESVEQERLEKHHDIEVRRNSHGQDIYTAVEYDKKSCGAQPRCVHRFIS